MNSSTSTKSDEELKKIRMESIYNALEAGWTVKKSNISPKTFEFTRNSSILKKNIDKNDDNDNAKHTYRRAISAPIVAKPIVSKNPKIKNNL